MSAICAGRHRRPLEDNVIVSRRSATHQCHALDEHIDRVGTSCRDLPVVARHAYKDVPSGTWALLTSLPSAEGRGRLFHVAWRNLAHDQLSDVMTREEAVDLLDLV
jgi:hypothetical protein